MNFNKIALVSGLVVSGIAVSSVFAPANASTGSFGFTVTETDTNATYPTSFGGDYYTSIVSAQGQITSVNGFSSLQGVSASNLTYNFGNLSLLNVQDNGTQNTETFGSNGTQIPYFNLLENGQVIATSNNITLINTSADAFYVPEDQTLDVVLNGVSGNPFFQEVLAQSNGDLVFNTGSSPTNTGPGTFTFTGTATAVPEPLNILGATTGLALFGTVSSALKKRKVSK